jgi:hypothetical protein
MAPLRSWLERVLGHGEDLPRDPDDIVDAGLVPYGTTPVVMGELERAGIPASAADWRAFAGEGPVTHSRIVVRAADYTDATRIIDELTTTS